MKCERIYLLKHAAATVAPITSGRVDRSEEGKLQLKDSRMALHSNWWLVKIFFHRVKIGSPDSHAWSNRNHKGGF
jgi:hypothetical protein